MPRLIQKIKPTENLCPKFLRVAAYARVSSGKDAMLHSLSAQVGYFTELIQSNPEWRMVGIYSDEALTGTKENREEFQRMLTDCREGKIDLILTKSISRFARNTVTLLETVRELKLLNVDVYFEEQNIHSISSDGELMLSILSSYAQEESRSVSENCKWRIRNDFAQGKVCSMKMLGYRRTKDGSLEVNADEAEIVKYIFALYLSGYGKLKISNILNEEHIPTLNGCEWTAGGVRRILDNEKYAGNMLLQKTFRENHITKKCRKNKGELQMYYVEESHEAIIEPSEFEAIKSITEKRQEKYSAPKHSDKYPFTGKIQCERCGKNYRRKTTATGIVWICSTFNTKGKKYCPTAKQIPETTLIAACCEMLKLLNFDVEKFNEQIERITVPSPNHLTFHFKDGTIENAVWKDRSRSESWTDEMKANAAETTKTRRWNK